jgi:RNA polymerase sigma-70 factor (ECF subfamily)
MDPLADRFETHRAHLIAVAHRMLGSSSEAEDAVQEAWLRLGRADTREVVNLAGWLTTVVARICLDLLRARTSRREAPLADAGVAIDHRPLPDAERQLADSIGAALLIVLELLAPAERIAFVLHDLFDLPFEEIGPIVERTPTAARQLASRARRRVQGAAALSAADRERQRAVVDAFLAASRDGDFDALLALLDPEVVLRADPAAIALAAGRPGAPALAPEVHGPRAVADIFKGRAGAARPALVDGRAGAAWAPGGTPRSVFAFEIRDGRIVGLELIMDAEHLAALDVVL